MNKIIKNELELGYQRSMQVKNEVYDHLSKMNGYALGLNSKPAEGNGNVLFRYEKKQAIICKGDKVQIIKREDPQDTNMFNGKKLSTPALAAAKEMGILTELNFIEIKNGGMQILEKYSEPNENLKSIYNSIMVSFKPITYVIREKDENLEAIVALKKSKFEMEYLEFINENKKIQLGLVDA